MKRRKQLSLKWKKIILSTIGVAGISITAGASAAMAATAHTTKPDITEHGIKFADHSNLFADSLHPIATTMQTLQTEYGVDTSAFDKYFNADSPRVFMQAVDPTTPDNVTSQFDALTVDLWTRAILEFKQANPTFDSSQFEFICKWKDGTFFDDLTNARIIADDTNQWGQIVLYDKIRNQYVSDESTMFSALQNKYDNPDTLSPFYLNDSNEQMTSVEKVGYQALVNQILDLNGNPMMDAINLSGQILANMRSQMPELTSPYSNLSPNDPNHPELDQKYGSYSLAIPGLTDANWQQYMTVSLSSDMSNPITDMSAIPNDYTYPIYVELKNVSIIETSMQDFSVKVRETGLNFTGSSKITVKLYQTGDLAKYMHIEYAKLQSEFDFYPVKFAIGDTAADMDMKFQAIMKFFDTSPFVQSHIEANWSPEDPSAPIDTTKANSGSVTVSLVNPTLDTGLDHILTELSAPGNLLSLKFNINYTVEPQDSLYMHPADPTQPTAQSRVFNDAGFLGYLDNVYDSTGTAIDWKTQAPKWGFDEVDDFTDGQHVVNVTSKYGEDNQFQNYIKMLTMNQETIDTPIQDDLVQVSQIQPDGTFSSPSYIQGTPQLVATTDGEYNEIVNVMAYDVAAMYAFKMTHGMVVGNTIGDLLVKLKQYGVPESVPVGREFTFEHSTQGVWKAAIGQEVTQQTTGSLDSNDIALMIGLSIQIVVGIFILPDMLAGLFDIITESFLFQALSRAVIALFQSQVDTVYEEVTVEVENNVDELIAQENAFTNAQYNEYTKYWLECINSRNPTLGFINFDDDFLNESLNTNYFSNPDTRWSPAGDMDFMGPNQFDRYVIEVDRYPLEFSDEEFNMISERYSIMRENQENLPYKYDPAEDEPYMDTFQKGRWGEWFAQDGGGFTPPSLPGPAEIWNKVCFKCLWPEESNAFNPYLDFQGMSDFYDDWSNAFNPIDWGPATH